MLFVGCGTGSPYIQNRSYVQFPEPPQAANSKCSNLKVLPGDSKIEDLTNIVSQNYESYHDCSSKNSLWMDWYVKQREIFNSKKVYQ
jgi:hypothetical protein